MKQATGGTIALTLVLVLAGCGSDGEERARTLPAPTGSASAGASNSPAAELKSDGDKTLTEAQLKAALLTVTDLPTGYTLDTSPDEEEDDTATTGDSDECSKKFEALEGQDEDAESAKADVSFTAGLGVILEQGLESYEDGDEIDKRLDAITEVLADCPTFTDTDEDGVKTDFNVGALSFPKLGDDTVALAITGKTPDFAISLNVVAIKLGRNVMLISQGGLTTDAAALEQAARKGVEKLAAATG